MSRFNDITFLTDCCAQTAKISAQHNSVMKTPKKRACFIQVVLWALAGLGAMRLRVRPQFFKTMRSKLFLELKTAYEPFSVLWNEWVQSANCLLNTDEIYTMEVHRMNDFKMDINEFIMYYNKREHTLELIRKLSMKSQYRRYKDFIIRRFEKRLLNLVIKKKLLLDSVPIHILPASNEEKTALKRFGKATVGEIINGYTTNDLRKSEVFALILDFVKLDVKK